MIKTRREGYTTPPNETDTFEEWLIWSSSVTVLTTNKTHENIDNNEPFNGHPRATAIPVGTTDGIAVIPLTLITAQFFVQSVQSDVFCLYGYGCDDIGS